jgi:hypothetical protein
MYELDNSGVDRPTGTSRTDWRNRLAQAEANYTAAVNHLQALLKTTPAYSASELDAAQKRKAEARAEYLHILRMFANIVVRSKRGEGL